MLPRLSTTSEIVWNAHHACGVTWLGSVSELLPHGRKRLLDVSGPDDIETDTEESASAWAQRRAREYAGRDCKRGG